MSPAVIVPLSIVGLWLACGFVASGWWYAYFQREFPEVAQRHRREDTRRAWRIIAFGPYALLECDEFSRHGWLFPGRLP